MKKALQVDPKGRLDVLAVRLVEAGIKARMGVPPENVLTLDLLRCGETLSRLGGFGEVYSSVRPHLAAFAERCGIQTVQTLPELACNLGIVPRATSKPKRRARCTR